MLGKLVLALGLGGVLAAVAVGVASAGISEIFGSDHDLGSPGNPTCKTCHIPHDAQGNYLWARTPSPGLPASEALCFSCHDGSITDRGDYIMEPGTVNHRMSSSPPMSRYHDGYCLACHDAHDPDWRFTWDLMRAGKPPNPDNAQVCLACHGLPYFDPAADKNHPWVTAAMSPPELPLDMTFDPGTGDTEGTRLWDSATLKEPVPAGSAGNVACLSCHAAHGAATENDTLNSMVENDGAKHAPICENCHQ